MRDSTPGTGSGPSDDGARPRAAGNSSVLLAAVRVASGAGLMWVVLCGLHVTASDPTEGAVLRIALRTTAGTAEVCRRVSPEELEKVPVHMRRSEICETHAVPYRLEVHAGPVVLLDRTYRATGLRGDRPLTVNENLTLAAGRHDVNIRFAPALPADMEPDKAAAIPPAFTFADAIDFPEGRIRVASLDATTGAFEIR